MTAVEVSRPRDGVALITFNLPRTLNAMTAGFVTELGDRLREIAADPGARVVVLTGSGRGFSAGHDLDAFAAVTADGSVERLMANQRAYSGLVLQINELPQPVIAAVNGPAAGGGFAMALAADTRVCAESAGFGAAAVRLGISGCDVGISYLLPRIVGPTLAFEMMLTGRVIDSREALERGLVLRVVEDRELLGAALEVADRIVGNSPFGVRMTRRAMWQGLDSPSLRHAIELEDRTQVLCLGTGDSDRALAAVRGKQPIGWPAPAPGQVSRRP